MFIVAWEGASPPADKAEWTEILREVLAGELGSYRVLFRHTPRGWRFELEWRDDGRSGEGEVIANSPDSVRYNIYVNLAGNGKPLDSSWQPWAGERSEERPREAPRVEPAERPKAASASRAAPPSRPAAGRRKKRGR